MAKGDSGKAQNMINTQGTLAQNYLTQLQQQNQMQAALAQQLYYGGQAGNQPSNTSSGSNNLPDSGTQQKIMDYIKQRQGQLPPTKDSLKQIVGELQNQGYDVQFARHGANNELESDDKIILPGGTMIDTINDVGGAGASWGTNYTEGPSGYGFTGNSGAPGSVGGAQGDYSQIQGQYGDLAKQYQGLLPQYQNVFNQYQDFANTGGFSPQDLANIRSRALSPIRSAYSSAKNDLERQKALQGGYAPNYGAASAKLAREQGYANADASTNVEGMLAQMKQQGRLAGLGGLYSGLSGMGSALGGVGNTLEGMRGLYGTTPAFANMLGNQMDSAMGRGINLGQLQNNLAGTLISGQINKAQVPSTFSQIMNNIGSVGRTVGGVIAPWLA